MKRFKECAWCKVVFAANPKLSSKQWEATLTCSIACRGALCRAERHAARPDLREVFHSGYRVDEKTGCWIWSGTITQYGYGQLRHRGRVYKTHVAALELDGRPVPKGMMACHHCDRPACVNPLHLYVGSPADNAKDASDRQRLRKGERHPQAKLDALAVKLIRTSGWSSSRLARWFGVSRATVASVKAGRTWRHVA